MRNLASIFLEKIFNIREGEMLRACLMQLSLFLVISTLLIVKPTATGLFLSEVGVEYLPVAFVLVAVVAIAISTLYSRLLGRTSLNILILITLQTSVLLFVSFGFLLKFDLAGKWVLYAFYVWVAIFGVLTASQFWILANVVFNAREAKRLFSFIGSGAIAGGIFGGYITTILAELIGSEYLPFVAAGLLFLCIPITIYIWNKSVLRPQSRFQRRKKIPRTNHPIQLIKRSSHLRNLAAIIGISVVVAKLVDYQFSAIASAKISDPDELTAFFGFWFSTFNVISLGIQLLFTRKIVGMFGVGSSLLFQPVAILIGAVFLFLFPEVLAFAILIKLSDGSMKQSINKAAVELLALPIPSETKSKTKTFIDVVVDSFATGLSGVLLIFVVNGLNLSTRSITIMITGLIIGWLIFVFRARKSYLDAFRENLIKATNEDKEMIDLKNNSVVADIKKVLEKGSESQINHLLKKLKTQPDERLSLELLNLLKHPSDIIKEGAIRNLYFFKNQDFSQVISPLAKNPSQSVKIAAFDYLLAHALSKNISLIESYLHGDDYKLRLAAIVGIAEESSDNPVLKEKFDLVGILNELYQGLDNIQDKNQRDFHKIGLLKALGFAKTPALFPVMREFFTDSNIKVASQALLSAGETLNPYFIPDLIQFLGNPSLSEVTVVALKKYGQEIVGSLKDYLRSGQPQSGVLRAIPFVFEHFGIQLSVDNLQFLLESKDGKVRLNALRALNSLKSDYPFLNFHQKEVIPLLLREAHLYQDTLSILYVHLNSENQNLGKDHTEKIKAAQYQLLQLLEKRLDGNLERIFRLLGLKYSPEDLISIYEGLQTREPEVRAYALEFLDNLLQPGLKKVLIPIVETAYLDVISEEAILQLRVKIPAESESYNILLGMEDQEVQNTVRNLLALLQTKG